MSGYGTRGCDLGMITVVLNWWSWKSFLTLLIPCYTKIFTQSALIYPFLQNWGCESSAWELLLRDLALLWDPADLQAHWTLKWTWQCFGFYANLLTLLPQIEGQAPRHTWSNMGHAMKPKSCFTSFIQHSHHRSSTCKKGCWGKTKWAHGNAMSQKLLYDYFLGC